ncbi:MAG TPA: type I-D CRISPR-associated protein Cas5/Csc1 [Alphaproteobacteria bacterium]|nr:type I-D CRISPR-associated protein Cas5/Csc1 [Alphaproteobacteria bacterium]
MEVYWGTLELLDYVFFATVERAKVYETGAFIHNYALAYAFHLASAPYSHVVQEPHYEEELHPANEQGVYLTPARPIEISHRRVQFNTIAEGYGFTGKERSIGYPDWGFIRVLRLGSRFEFYALVADPTALPGMSMFGAALNGTPVYIRLGKFSGKARVRFQKSRSVEEGQGDFTANALLNWRDLPVEPIFPGDIYPAALPTRLVANSRFIDALYYRAHFGEEAVRLPGGMRFLARPIDRRKRR